MSPISRRSSLPPLGASWAPLWMDLPWGESRSRIILNPQGPWESPMSDFLTSLGVIPDSIGKEPLLVELLIFAKILRSGSASLLHASPSCPALLWLDGSFQATRSVIVYFWLAGAKHRVQTFAAKSLTQEINPSQLTQRVISENWPANTIQLEWTLSVYSGRNSNKFGTHCNSWWINESR